MYLARNAQRVVHLLANHPGISIRGAIKELVTAARIEKHAAPRPAIEWVERLPPNVEIEQADAAALPLPDDLVDLIVTSPPYNLDLAYGAGIDDNLDYATYLDRVSEWAQEMYRVAGVNGRAAINVPLDTMAGGTPRPVYADWIARLQWAGWTYRSTLVWDEQTVTKSTARGSIGQPSAPYVAAPVEMIILVHRGSWAVERPGVVSDLTREESVAWQGPAAGLWRFGGSSNPDYPGTFPPELPRRLIKLLSWPGDTVLDPFCGSGTTIRVAQTLGRSAYGFDANPRAVSLARQAVAGEQEAA
jgi:site-specific DNA-methyltransferase (adenine-specific)